MSARFSAIPVVLGVVLGALSAHADVPPPSGDCTGKKEGEACMDDQHRPGACGTVAYTATNNATQPPSTSQRTYFGCRSGDKPKAKACSLSVAGAPSSDGAYALVLLVAAAAAFRRRSRA